MFKLITESAVSRTKVMKRGGELAGRNIPGTGRAFAGKHKMLPPHIGLARSRAAGSVHPMTLRASNDIAEMLAALPAGQRHLVALAGPPGAGKSTLAEALVDRLNATSPGRGAILPMDGYHFDDQVLEARGLRPQKGAPNTFDVGGLASMLARLRRNDEPEVAVPVFDRSIEIARAGAAMIPQTVEIVLVEGNYVLLDAAPWGQLAGQFDLTAMIRIDEDALRRRLMARWLGLGLGQEAAAQKVDANDLPNGLTVLRQSRAADIEIDGARPIEF